MSTHLSPSPATVADVIGDPVEEAERRRTFAVISHPDAGKSTLTEAIALHADVIDEAGAVHGKAGRRGVVSDWMDMERARGISITSAALRFAYGDTVINLLDTPGHADFSEDTYRVLSAVDSAVMLLDAAKGLEPQTLKLFEVCQTRGLPILTFINKWDRPGLEPLQLLDQLVERLGIRPMPLTWPVGIAGDFRGVLDVATGELVEFMRRPGGASVAGAERFAPKEAAARHGDAWTTAVEELELLRESGHGYDDAAFWRGEATPVMFGAAVVNFGVRQLLRTLVDKAPAPGAREDWKGARRPLDSPFSGFVFKVQAGMDAAHRDRMAFVRVCSGVFERGMLVTHAQTGKPFATKYAQTVFGRARQTLDRAYPGDVVGLVNASSLRVGDSLYDREMVSYPPIPKFAPEHFAAARPQDPSRAKQFRRGIEQLDQEGVVQVLVSDRRGPQAPVLAAVGPLQFEVVEARMRQEFSAAVTLERLGYSVARQASPEVEQRLDSRPGAEVLTRTDGVVVALFADRWRLSSVERELPPGSLSSLLAGN